MIYLQSSKPRRFSRSSRSSFCLRGITSSKDISGIYGSIVKTPSHPLFILYKTSSLPFFFLSFTSVSRNDPSDKFFTPQGVKSRVAWKFRAIHFVSEGTRDDIDKVISSPFLAELRRVARRTRSVSLPSYSDPEHEIDAAHFVSSSSTPGQQVDSYRRSS